MKHIVAGFIGAGHCLMAAPAFAGVSDGESSKAIWIALGVTFSGAFIAIFGSVIAATAARKKQDGPDDE
jgi:hypothetical protein